MTEVSLRSVSGKQCVLKTPFSWESFLTACETELGFDRQTVKTHYDGHIRGVADIALTTDDTSDVDISRLAGTVASSLSSSPTPERAPGVARTKAAHDRGETGAPPDGVTVLVFGRPRKVADLHLSTAPLRTAPTSSSRPRHPSLASARHPPALENEFTGPLHCPHCPDGLRDMARIVGTRQELHDAFVVEIYRHPTMQHIIREAAGDMDYLHGVMEQIALVTPSLFEWIQRNPLGFVRMLNRNEPTLQELRATALLQLMQQLSSEVALGHNEFTVEVEGAFASSLELRITVEPPVYDPHGDDGDEDDLFGSHSDDMFAADDDEHDVDGEDSDDDGGLIAVDQDANDTIWVGDQSVQVLNPQCPLLAVLGINLPELSNNLEVPATRSSSGPTTTTTITLTPTRQSEGQTAAPVVGARQPAAASSASAEAPRADGAPPSPSSPPPPPPPPLPLPLSLLPTEAPSGPTTASALAVEALSRDTCADVADGTAETTTAWSSQAEALDTRMSAARTVGACAAWQRADPALATDLARFSEALFVELQRRLANHDAASTASPSAFLRLASQHFADVEELYVVSVEMSAPAIAPSTDPTSSLAGRACSAALAQQLLCACATLLTVPAALAPAWSAAEAPAGDSTPTSVRRRTMSDGRPRLGALRNFPDTGSVLLQPVVQWIAPGGPQALLRSLLKVAKEQAAAAVLWYTSHYFTKREGKTVQTVGYVLDAGQVRLARLPFNSKAHKQDEAAELMARLEQATAASGGGGVPDRLRAEWGLLMKRLYKTMVKPLEAHLPTPNTTANPLYVMDTRHTPCPRDAEKPSTGPGRSAARWFGAYSDERNMLCTDKWCVALSERPWHVVLAHDAPWAPLEAAQPSQPLALLLLGSPSTTAPYWLTEPLQRVYDFRQYAMSALPPSALHTVVLHESDCGLHVPLARRRTSQAAERPIVADLHIVDDCDKDGNADRLTTQRATVVRNAQLSVDEEFYTLLYEKLALFPAMPLAAAVRAVSLSLMVQHNAPWRVVEFSLMDYGGMLTTLMPMFDRVRQRRAPVHHAAAVASSASMVEDAESREYARSHGVLNLFESMLSHVMEERPPTTGAALDSLIQYVESSKSTLKQQVQSSAPASANAMPNTAAAARTAPVVSAAPRHRSIPTQSPSADATTAPAPHTPSNASGNRTPHRPFTRRPTR